MALWRDPLGELIDALEGALPQEAGPADWRIPSAADVQFAVCPFLFGTEEEKERARRDPRVQAVWAYYERLGRRLQASGILNATAGKTDPPPETV